MRLRTIMDETAIGVVGSPRLTNEALYVLRKFATELVGTDNYTTTDRFQSQAVLREPRRAARDASRHSLREDDRSDRRRSGEVAAADGKADSPGSAKRRREIRARQSVPIRLREQAARVSSHPTGNRRRIVLALADPANDALWRRKKRVLKLSESMRARR